ncbi:MAG: FliI/YscN family ATPase [Gemmobacter sp.]
MRTDLFAGLRGQLQRTRVIRRVGRIAALSGGVLRIDGLSEVAAVADAISVCDRSGTLRSGEVLAIEAGQLRAICDGGGEGLGSGDAVVLEGAVRIAPDEGWLGRIIDPDGRPLDGRPLLGGPAARPLRAAPPAPAFRRPLGPRLETGLRAFNTLLPLVRGQRIGLFAGPGVGKSTLLGALARGVEADVVVIAMIGERGRELREFTGRVLGPAGLARSVVVCATSDTSPILRRRCAWTAMAVAEHFRDQGLQVLFLADSITRFAEAHREIALAAGEGAGLRGYPPSVAPLVMGLAERAGPGPAGAGDITAVFTVLVPGADMDEPVADILRGTLDGHVVLDRRIAERGRFPAIDLLRSLSRSLPDAASDEENALISDARRLLGAWDRAEPMIQAGLYVAGSDPLVDRAIAVWPDLDAFLAEEETDGVAASFAVLRACLGKR